MRVNERLEEMTGYAREELLGRLVEILVPGAWRERHVRERTRYVSAPWVRHVGSGLPLSILRKDGSELPVDIGLSPVTTTEGLFVACAVREDTARRRAEELLRQSERSLAQAQRIARLGSWVWDTATGELRWSDEVFRIFGYAPQAFDPTYEAFLGAVHPEDRAAVEEAVRAALEEREPYAVDHRIVLPDGRERIVHEQAEVQFDGDGRAIGMVGTVQDITEHKRAEEHLERSLALLRRTSSERRRLLAHLVKAREEERARIAGDIHDDPLQKIAALGLRLGILKDSLRDPEQLRLLEPIERTVAQAIASLRAMLFELRPLTLDQDGLAAALRELLQHLGEESSVETSLVDRLEQEPEPESRVICYRIAQEALGNVRKHSRAARVEVVLGSEEGGTIITVRDDGVGFSPEAVPLAPGHLGLPDMRERAELAGGWLRIQSAPGAGTTVEFWVPGQGDRPEVKA